MGKYTKQRVALARSIKKSKPVKAAARLKSKKRKDGRGAFDMLHTFVSDNSEIDDTQELPE